MMTRTNKIKKLLTAVGALTIVAAMCLPMVFAGAPVGKWRKASNTSGWPYAVWDTPEAHFVEAGALRYSDGALLGLRRVQGTGYQIAEAGGGPYSFSGHSGYWNWGNG